MQWDLTSYPSFKMVCMGCAVRGLRDSGTLLRDAFYTGYKSKWQKCIHLCTNHFLLQLYICVLIIFFAVASTNQKYIHPYLHNKHAARLLHCPRMCPFCAMSVWAHAHNCSWAHAHMLILHERIWARAHNCSWAHAHLSSGPMARRQGVN
jgi:hypothetical protein